MDGLREAEDTFFSDIVAKDPGKAAVIPRAVYGTAVVDLDTAKFSVWRQQQSVDDMLTVLG